jgi:DNA repair exonuclease SbcCD nuclease subunit
MVRFAHIADVHLGGWKQQPLQDLNFKTFQIVIEKCLEYKPDFVIIAGDLFDTAYPGIEILKGTFAELKKLKDARIPCFIIAGSHDYSVSGKTFLDVLEKAGFCKNVADYEEIDENTIMLNPIIHEGIAFYGYPGRKSGLEVADIRKIKLNDAPGMFKIFLLHTTLDKVVGTLPIDSVQSDLLPKADYYALGHIHVEFNRDNFVYPGPIFPNNFAELEDLGQGSFCFVDTESQNTLERIRVKIKDTLKIKIEVNNALTATDQIISEMGNYELEDKIILLRVKGIIETGKNSDIKFQKIEEYAREKGAYFLLRNTHDLKEKQPKLNIDIESKNEEDIEKETMKVYSDENPSDFNELMPELINALSIEKEEGEKTEMFENRLIDSTRKILRF